MYYIAVYDVGEKRVGKMLKLFRGFLNWVQNSVFEGELTESQVVDLKHRAKKLMNQEEDSIIFYALRDEKWMNKTILGKEKDELTHNIL